MNIEILQLTPNSEKLIEKIGRLCYKSEDKITDTSYLPFITSLIKRGHESVLEHASVTFKASNISRSCSHQLVRHRIASYTQVSHRYTKIESEEDLNYYIPHSVVNHNNENIEEIYDAHMKKSFQLYTLLLQEGLKPEDARYILPQSISSDIIVTMNFRSLRNFLKERTSIGAQKEIKELAFSLIEKLRNEGINDVFFQEIV